MSWLEWAAAETDNLRALERERSLREFDTAGPTGRLEGRPVVSFASNDYLGLSRHPEVIGAAQEAAGRWGAGAGSARLIVGSRPVHAALESALAGWKGSEAALLFSSGYTANLGALTTFGGPTVLRSRRGGPADTTIFSDERNHASIVDGCRLARSEVVVYPHRDLEALDERLSRCARPIVVSDTVFSMDGDVAPVEALVELCMRRGALLILDEAHAVLGPPLRPPPDAAVLRVGTLSKFLGAAGGFVAGPRALVDLLINRARSFIFTTAGSPADAAAALAALKVLNGPEGASLVRRLRSLVETVAPGHPSPIIPIVLGEDGRALNASRALLERGLFVPAIRPPSVAPGTARLRVTLSAAHTDEQIAELTVALDRIKERVLA
ncbi:MAG: aminotransferase class I/II-fold pyridoxal phosphate-dependent enzyme [Actinomycetota bacterium]